MRTISQEIPQPSITKISLKITSQKCLFNLLGDNELNQCSASPERGPNNPTSLIALPSHAWGFVYMTGHVVLIDTITFQRWDGKVWSNIKRSYSIVHRRKKICKKATVRKNCLVNYINENINIQALEPRYIPTGEVYSSTCNRCYHTTNDLNAHEMANGCLNFFVPIFSTWNIKMFLWCKSTPPPHADTWHLWHLT